MRAAACRAEDGRQAGRRGARRGKAEALARAKAMGGAGQGRRGGATGAAEHVRDGHGRCPTSWRTARRPAARTTTSCSSTVGTPRTCTELGLKPRDHLELGEALGAIDMERGAKVSGARFYYLTGVGARLELAMLTRPSTSAMAAGFTPDDPPDPGPARDYAGHGFLGKHAAEVYRLRGRRPVPRRDVRGRARGVPRGRDPRPVRGPQRYAGWSACYRREAGSTARTPAASSGCTSSTRSRCSPSAARRGRRRRAPAAARVRRRCSPSVELPYRVIDTAAGDLGSSAARKYDCEAWLPSQGATWS